MRIIPKKELDRVGVDTSRQYKEYVRGLVTLLDDVTQELLECQNIPKATWNHGVKTKAWLRDVKKAISQQHWGR